MTDRFAKVTYSPPVPGETTKEAQARRDANRRSQHDAILWHRARCCKCGYARINVRHETDPETAPEGPAYYADMLAELHEFVPC